MSQVVLALLCYRGKVLTCWSRRSVARAYGWEFPGGHVQAGESAEEAVHRLVRETIGVEPQAMQCVLKYDDTSSQHKQQVQVYQVDADPHKIEAQKEQFLRWYQLHQLRYEDFLPADRVIVNTLGLPQYNAITPAWNDPTEVIEGVQRMLGKHTQRWLLTVRLPQMPNYPELIQRIVTMVPAENVQVLMHDHLDALDELSEHVAGIHLSQKVFCQTQQRPISSSKIFSVSCHNLQELRCAEERGADFCMLSPIRTTSKLATQPTLGWESFAELIQQVQLPVFALGGMQLEDLDTAHQHGAHGIAGIRCFQEDASAHV